MKKFLLVLPLIIFSTLKSLAASSIDTSKLDIDNVGQYGEMSFDTDFRYWIKFSILLNNQGKIPTDNKVREGEGLFFQDSQNLKFHSDYLKKKIPDFKNLTSVQINDLTLNKKGRRAFVGTLFIKPNDEMSYENSIGVFEVITAENLELDLIIQIQSLLRKALAPNFVNELKFLPQPQFKTETMAQAELFEKKGVRLYNLMPSTDRICYTSGTGFGKVKILSTDQLESQQKDGLISPMDIIITDSLPRELTPIAGVIMQEVSSPSSHGALLGQMLGFPVVYQKNAKQIWQSLEGKSVFVTASGVGNSCLIDKAEISNDQAIKKLTVLKSPSPSKDQPKLDLSLTKILPTKDLSFSDVAKVGGKASNFSRLTKNLASDHVPTAVAIPVSYYYRYLNEAKASNGLPLKTFIQSELIKIQSPDTNQAKILEVVRGIRKTLKDTEIPAPIIAEIRQQLSSIFKNNNIKLKFRSSSNVEDLKYFNGAGLYDSKGVCLADLDSSAKVSVCDNNSEPDTLEKGLHKVWSSLYKDQAYLARRYLGIKEDNIAMGILVHPSYRGELANGVAILERSQNTSEKDSYQVTVTGFPGEDLEVVHPPVGKVPETTMLELRFDKSVSVDVLTRSTEVPRSKNLLEKAEYEKLYELMSKIAKTWEGEPFGSLDFEWKIANNSKNQRVVVLKQVREVPTGQVRESNKSTDLVWVLETSSNGKNKNLVVSSFQEQGFGLGELKGNLALEIDAPYLSLNDLKKGRTNINSAKITTIDGAFTISGDKITSVVSQTRSGIEVHLSLPNPTLPNLKLTLMEQSLDKQKGNNIHLFGEQFYYSGGLMYSAPMTDFGGISMKEAQDIQQDPIFMWTGKAPYRAQFDTLERPSFDSTEKFKGNLLKLQFRSTSSYGGYDKTMRRNLSAVTIEGLFGIQKTIVINNPNAMAYSPKHHNFGWEYAFDLTKAEGMEATVKQKLINLGARYLVVSTIQSAPELNGKITATLWSDSNGLVEVLETELIPEGALISPHPGSGSHL